MSLLRNNLQSIAQNLKKIEIISMLMQKPESITALTIDGSVPILFLASFSYDLSCPGFIIIQ